MQVAAVQQTVPGYTVKMEWEIKVLETNKLLRKPLQQSTKLAKKVFSRAQIQVTSQGDQMPIWHVFCSLYTQLQGPQNFG